MIQRQFLRAHHRHWQPGGAEFDEGDNPVSAIYGARMVDPDRIFCWTWDARPYPAFPKFTDVWSDGPNHQTGHWLTGRLGAAASDELTEAMANDYGANQVTATTSGALVAGVQVSAVSTLRAAVSPLLEATGLSVRVSPAGLSFIGDGDAGTLDMSRDQLAVFDGPVIKRTRPNATEVPGQLSLTYFSREREYQAASVVAFTGSNPHKVAVSSNLALNSDTARTAAETHLRHQTPSETMSLILPPSRQAVETGDHINIAEVNGGPVAVETVRTGLALDVSGRVQGAPPVANFAGELRTSPQQNPQTASSPVVIAAHLPGAAGDVMPTSLVLGAYAQPWPGSIRIIGQTLGNELARLNDMATIGELVADLGAAPPFVWDKTNDLRVHLHSGHLFSTSEAEALAGANQLAVLHDDGAWEILGFADASLEGPLSYSLSRLLRGQNGTDHAVASLASVGNPVMVLNSAIARTPLSVGDLGGTYQLKRFAGALDLLGQSFGLELGMGPALPLAPTSLTARRVPETGDITISWLRRSRVGGDSWALPNLPLDYAPENYRLRIYVEDSPVRELFQSNSAFTYTIAMQTADFGGVATAFSFTVEQVSAVLGAGHTAAAEFGG